MLPAPTIIDDLRGEPLVATIGSVWQLVTDQVMGGISKGVMGREVVASRAAIRVRGDVSLENMEDLFKQPSTSRRQLMSWMQVAGMGLRSTCSAMARITAFT